jgi:DTW domain-containing protein YfiP
MINHKDIKCKICNHTIEHCMCREYKQLEISDIEDFFDVVEYIKEEY